MSGMAGLERAMYLLRIGIDRTSNVSMTVLKRSGKTFTASQTLSGNDGRDIDYLIDLVRIKLLQQTEPTINLYNSTELFWVLDEEAGYALFTISGILSQMDFRERLEFYEAVGLFTSMKTLDFKRLNSALKTWQLVKKL